MFDAFALVYVCTHWSAVGDMLGVVGWVLLVLAAPFALLFAIRALQWLLYIDLRTGKPTRPF
ncbi:MAG TPA: hypothetical protein VI299_03865 [Polyangiales bacterium]